MLTNRAGAELNFTSSGRGTPVLVLHGAYSAHEEIRAAVEPVLSLGVRYRGIYPDLPGMGATPAHGSIQSSNDVLDLLGDLIDSEIAGDPFLIMGHSFGGHLARGIAARYPQQVAGMALICPLMPATMNAEEHVIVRTCDEATHMIDPDHVDDYTGYFVVQTPETARRFRAAVVPVLGRWDGDAVHRVMENWALDPNPDTTSFDQPTLVLTGRHDSTVGYRDQVDLLDRYPGATYVAVADAGHALPHEHPELFAHLVGDWLARAVPPADP